MKNKSLWLRSSLMVSIVWLFWLSFVSAINFHLNIDDMKALSPDDVTRSIMPIHFADNWNDFGGFFYFSNGLWDSSDTNWDYDKKVTIWPGGSDREYDCSKQVKWFYYNAERWERLWPLSKDNSFSGVSVTWWIYTVCEQPWYTEDLKKCSEDGNGQISIEKCNLLRGSREMCEECLRSEYHTDGHWYYWSLTWKYPENGGQEYSLVVWVEYDTGNDFIEIKNNSKLAPTFVRFENKYPVGFIYDTNWWVGFVWCRIVNSSISMKQIVWQITWDLKNLFQLSGNNSIEYVWEWKGGVNCSDAVWDSLVWVVVEWIVWLGERSNTASDFWIIWNEMDEKMQYFSSASINNNTLINYAKKKAEVLCRWKWNSWCSESLCCYNGDVELSWPDSNTYIVKNWNVTINPFTDSNENKYYSVFVVTSGYNLIIKETDLTTKFVFTTGGNVSPTSPEGFSSNVTEAIGPDKTGQYSGKDATVASLIKWNFIVNWKIKGSSTVKKPDETVYGEKLANKYFIYWKLTSRDDFNSLSDTFQWRCNNWITTDWTVCPRSFKNDDWTYWRLNPYEAAFLVVIDQNYDSPLYNS